MDPRALLESLLQSGKELATQTLESGRDLAEKGRDLAEDKLGIPEDGTQRDETLSNLGKGAAVGGLLALLVGTERGRDVAGSAAKIGGLAALGGLAYKVYRDYQSKNGDSTEIGSSVSDLSGDEGQNRSVNLIKAMIAAAKADGHMDSTEQARLIEQIQVLGLDESVATSLKDEIGRPLNAQEIASLSDSPAAAAEIYLASRMVIDVDRQSERDYLDALSNALKLDPLFVAELESEAMAA
ncbi:MAG: tellurite resistance TerB family protein [Planctomycetaceae bacterium]